MTFKKLLDLMIPIIPNILLTVLPSAFRYMGNIIEKKMFCSDKQVEKANMEFAKIIAAYILTYRIPTKEHIQNLREMIIRKYGIRDYHLAEMRDILERAYLFVWASEIITLKKKGIFERFYLEITPILLDRDTFVKRNFKQRYCLLFPSRSVFFHEVLVTAGIGFVLSIIYGLFLFQKDELDLLEWLSVGVAILVVVLIGSILSSFVGALMGTLVRSFRGK